jgi:arsenate reductase
VAPHGLDPRAVKVMAEACVDISGHTSKHVDTLLHLPFDYVVTVCDSAAERCPVFPGKAMKFHRSFQDPPALASGARTEKQALEHYRQVRDEIRAFVETLPETLSGEGAAT